MPRYPEFCGGSYRAQSYSSSPNRLMNWYVERSQDKSQTSPTALYPTPGALDFGTSSQTGGRAIFSTTLQGVERLFAVIGSKLVELDQFGMETVLGEVGDDGKPAKITSNGDAATQILVASNNNGFCYDATTGVFSQVRTGGTRVVDMLDGFGLALDVDQSAIFVSAQYDFTSWDPTDIIQRSDASDPWVSLIVSNSLIWALGKETSLPLYNAGNPVIPFAAHPTGTIGVGIVGSFAVTDLDGKATWVSATRRGVGKVVTADGFTPTAISDFGVSVALESYFSNRQIDDCYAESYAELGHTFALFTFPRARATWGWSEESGTIWHERGRWNSADMRFETWGPAFHALFKNKHVWVVRTSNEVVITSPDYGFDLGATPLRRVRVARGPFNEAKMVSFRELTVFVQPGVGTLAVPNPTASLRVSRDGSKTWGNSMPRTAGRMGQFNKLPMTWLNLGTCQDPVVEFSTTTGVPLRVIDAYARGN